MRNRGASQVLAPCAEFRRSAGSGWAGAAGCRGRRARCPSGRICRGQPGRSGEQAPVDVLIQGCELAAVADDQRTDFPPKRMARHDAEVAADIRDDGADRPMTDFCGDALRRGQGSEIGVLTGLCGRGAGQRRAGRRRGDGFPFRVQMACAADQPRLERLGAEQAGGDAREDCRDVGGAEVAGVVGEAGDGAGLLEGGGEVFRVVDQPADEAEQVRGAAGLFRRGGFWGGRGGGGRGGHARNKITECGRCKGIIS